MAQGSALREQPSMDEILASIRRIIDAGETRAKPPLQAVEERVEPVSTVLPPPANDPGTNRARAPQAMSPQQPQTARDAERFEPRQAVPAPRSDAEIAAAVSAYLAEESLTRQPARIEPPLHEPDPFRSRAPQSGPFTGAPSRHPDDPAPLPGGLDELSDLTEAEAVLLGDFAAVDRDLLAEKRAKYDARFSEADSGTFQKVGDLLRGSFNLKPEADEPVAASGSGSLVSEAVSSTVSQSLSSLAELAEATSRRAAPDLDAMANEMLRPMLQEWLDNNLPSLVERLVRAEIERIARGEPRTA